MPKPLDDQIAQLRARIARDERALQLLLEAQRELMDAVVEEHRGLHSTVNSRTLSSEQMQANTRSLAISEGGHGKDPFLRAIRAKGFTLRSLAGKVGCQPSLLSMQRAGTRPIPAERAKAIEGLTGWPADKKHWPGGLS